MVNTIFYAKTLVRQQEAARRNGIIWNFRIPYYVIIGLDPMISVMRSPDQVGG